MESGDDRREISRFIDDIAGCDDDERGGDDSEENDTSCNEVHDDEELSPEEQPDDTKDHAEMDKNKSRGGEVPMDDSEDDSESVSASPSGSEHQHVRGAHRPQRRSVVESDTDDDDIDGEEGGDSESEDPLGVENDHERQAASSSSRPPNGKREAALNRAHRRRRSGDGRRAPFIIDSGLTFQELDPGRSILFEMEEKWKVSSFLEACSNRTGLTLEFIQRHIKESSMYATNYIFMNRDSKQSVQTAINWLGLPSHTRPEDLLENNIKSLETKVRKFTTDIHNTREQIERFTAYMKESDKDGAEESVNVSTESRWDRKDNSGEVDEKKATSSMDVSQWRARPNPGSPFSEDYKSLVQFSLDLSVYGRCVQHVADKLRLVATSLLHCQYWNGGRHDSSFVSKLKSSSEVSGGFKEYDRDGYVPRTVYNARKKEHMRMGRVWSAKTAITLKIKEFSIRRRGSDIVTPGLNHRLYDLSGTVTDVTGYIGCDIEKDLGMMQADSFPLPTWMPFIHPRELTSVGNSRQQFGIGHTVTFPDFISMTCPILGNDPVTATVHNAFQKTSKLAEAVEEDRYNALRTIKTDPNCFTCRNGVFFLDRNSKRTYVLAGEDVLKRAPLRFIPYGDPRLNPNDPRSLMYNKTACKHINADFDPQILSASDPKHIQTPYLDSILDMQDFPEEYKAHLLGLLGRACSGDDDYQEELFMWGASRSGKGLLLSLVKAMLPNTRYGAWSGGGGGEKGFGLEAFFDSETNRSHVYCIGMNEWNPQCARDTSDLLEILEKTDSLEVRRKRKTAIQCNVECHFIGISNGTGMFDNDNADAMMNRLIVSHHRKTVKGSDRFDPKLETKLTSGEEIIKSIAKTQWYWRKLFHRVSSMPGKGLGDVLHSDFKRNKHHVMIKKCPISKSLEDETVFVTDDLYRKHDNPETGEKRGDRVPRYISLVKLVDALRKNFSNDCGKVTSAKVKEVINTLWKKSTLKIVEAKDDSHTFTYHEDEDCRVKVVGIDVRDYPYIPAGLSNGSDYNRQERQRQEIESGSQDEKDIRDSKQDTWQVLSTAIEAEPVDGGAVEVSSQDIASPTESPGDYLRMARIKFKPILHGIKRWYKTCVLEVRVNTLDGRPDDTKDMGCINIPEGDDIEDDAFGSSNIQSVMHPYVVHLFRNRAKGDAFDQERACKEKTEPHLSENWFKKMMNLTISESHASVFYSLAHRLHVLVLTSACVQSGLLQIDGFLEYASILTADTRAFFHWGFMASVLFSYDFIFTNVKGFRLKDLTNPLKRWTWLVRSSMPLDIFDKACTLVRSMASRSLANDRTGVMIGGCKELFRVFMNGLHMVSAVNSTRMGRGILQKYPRMYEPNRVPVRIGTPWSMGRYKDASNSFRFPALQSIPTGEYIDHALRVFRTESVGGSSVDQFTAKGFFWKSMEDTLNSFLTLMYTPLRIEERLDILSNISRLPDEDGRLNNRRFRPSRRDASSSAKHYDLIDRITPLVSGILSDIVSYNMHSWSSTKECKRVGIVDASYIPSITSRNENRRNLRIRDPVSRLLYSNFAKIISAPRDTNTIRQSFWSVHSANAYRLNIEKVIQNRHARNVHRIRFGASRFRIGGVVCDEPVTVMIEKSITYPHTWDNIQRLARRLDQDTQVQPGSATGTPNVNSSYGDPGSITSHSGKRAQSERDDEERIEQAGPSRKRFRRTTPEMKETVHGSSSA